MTRVTLAALSFVLISCIGDPADLTGGPDAGPPDADHPDTGEPDTSEPDTGDRDTGGPDAGGPDTGDRDTGGPDADTDTNGVDPDACNPTATPFGSGPYSDEDPNLICSIEHLRAIKDHLDGHFLMNEDMTLDANLEPIGSFEEPFTGRFDGGGNTLQGLSVQIDEPFVGLFGAIDGATIEHLTIEDATIHGSGPVGILAGEMKDGLVSHVVVSGTVNADNPDMDQVGGLVGRIEGGEILDSHVEAVVHGRTQVGLLVGRQSFGDITNPTEIRGCSARGQVHAAREVGGLVGRSEGLIEQSFVFSVNADPTTIELRLFQGGAMGPEGTGGLVGTCVGCKLAETSAEGVEMQYVDNAVAINVGGLVGWVDGESAISNSYVRGGDLGDTEPNSLGRLVGAVGSGSVEIHHNYSTIAVPHDDLCLVSRDGGEPDVYESYFPLDAGQDDRCEEEGRADFSTLEPFMEWQDEIWIKETTSIAAGHGPDHVYRE